MAEEVVVREPLTPEMKSAGEELTRRLDRAKLRVVASFWFFVVEANEWRLILAFPMARTEGPRAAYAAVQSALLQAPKEAVRCLSLRNITLLSPDAPSGLRNPG